MIELKEHLQLSNMKISKLVGYGKVTFLKIRAIWGPCATEPTGRERSH